LEDVKTQNRPRPIPLRSLGGAPMSDINQAPQTIAQTIDWLHNCLGRPALPECPKECERDCDVPGGKAPGWINQKGKAVKVSWKPYWN
jgi:hypothetical protein